MEILHEYFTALNAFSTNYLRDCIKGRSFIKKSTENQTFMTTYLIQSIGKRLKGLVNGNK